MKNYTGVSNSAHKKGAQSLGGPTQLTAMSVVNSTTNAVEGSQAAQMMRHASMTPDRHTSNSNQQIFSNATQ